MIVTIFGLGYVGCVTAACFARDGHQVIGVDIKREKIESIRQGKSPIIEPGLEQLIQAGIASRNLEVTDDAAYAVAHADLIMVCVGTPSKKNGDLELTFVEKVCGEIGRELSYKSSYSVVVVRSTVLPGSATHRIIPILEAESGKCVRRDFGFCINPEFLREGSAISDFDDPPYTVIGEIDEKSGERVAELYASINTQLYRVPLGTAEMIKYASNSFHALKVAFANEIGNLCQAYSVDSHQVMDIFIQDTKLNLSPYYLKPGFAFGGSCLPKDLRALLYSARQADIYMPVLEAILPSNELQTQKAFEMLIESKKRKIGLIGLSFKPSTDDLRESPAIELAERLIGKGFELYIYDQEVSFSKLHGSNRAYFEQVIPHLSSLMQPSLEETIRQSEVIVVAKRPSAAEYKRLIQLLQPNQILIDLVRLNGQKMRHFEGSYHGICW